MDKITNRQFSRTDTHFLECCKTAGVEPTVRQASKFRRKMGKAYKVCVLKMEVR